MRKNTLFRFVLISLIFLTMEKNKAQNARYKAAAIGFYNVENLFDTIESAGLVDGSLPYQDEFYHRSIPVSEISKYDTVDCKCKYSEKNLKGKQIIRQLILTDQYLPNGSKGWTSKRYKRKIDNLAKVIADLGREYTKDFPAIVGLAEVENREVVQDIVNSDFLKKANYGIVHYNSWDARGIDVALIYQKDRFEVEETTKMEVEIYEGNGSRDYTRDILKVKGKLDGERVYVFVNHWPSRRGGEKVSFPKRKKAAEVLRKAFEDIKKKEPEAKIMAMGDFNDGPVDESISEVLGAGNKPNEIVNLMLPMYEKGFGTLAYRDSWNLFDQIIVTKILTNKQYDKYSIYKSGIFNPYYLINPTGPYKGYPQRTHAGDSYNPNGYSDHFPVYTVLIRKVK